MASIPFTNAIWWAQFRLLGGWKNLLLTVGAYAAILGTTMFTIVRAVREVRSTTFGYFVGLIVGLQALVLVVYGTLRAAGAVRADVTSRIIESHRLMPLTPGNAVLGYLLGSTFQAMAFFVVNFILGAIAVAGAALPVQSWLFSNAVLLGFSLFVWCIVIFFSFRSGFAGMGMIGGAILMTMSGGMLLELLPGLNVLISPLIGHTIFDMRAGQTIDMPFVASAALQFCIGLLYVIAASRRYQRDDAIGFTAVLGLLLLICWATACALGLSGPDSFRFRRMFYSDNEAAFITSVASVLLMATLPISSAVHIDEHRARRRESWLPPMFVALVAAIVCAMMTDIAPAARMALLLRTLLAAFAFLAGIRYLLGIAHTLGWRTRLVLVGWLVLTWGVPLLLEAVRVAATMDPNDRTSQLAMACAPGEIYQIWSRDSHVHTNAFAGLAFQCALALVMGVTYHLVRRRSTSGKQISRRKRQHSIR